MTCPFWSAEKARGSLSPAALQKPPKVVVLCVWREERRGEEEKEREGTGGIEKERGGREGRDVCVGEGGGGGRRGSEGKYSCPGEKCSFDLLRQCIHLFLAVILRLHASAPVEPLFALRGAPLFCEF